MARRASPSRAPAVVAALVIVLMFVPIRARTDDGSGSPESGDRRLTRSRFGEFVFPVSGDPATTWWEARHWDDSNAVDIRVNPRFGTRAAEREEFAGREAVAVSSGTVERRDNPRGGIAVVLYGDDGRTYYYAHLARSGIGAPRHVVRGEVLGEIGNTGVWTRYLEPHLHFSIAEGFQPGLDWEADVDAVRWITSNFALAPDPVDVDAYRGAYPAGAPLFGDYVIIRPFADARSENRNLAGVTIESLSSGRVPIRAPLAGEIRIHADTALGTRLQVTNRITNQSVIISGDIAPVVTYGTIVYADMVIGSGVGRIHYMYFDKGVARDPLSR